MAESPANNQNLPTGGTVDTTTLVQKHVNAIDHLLESQDRQKTYFKDHGIDPDKLMTEHYSDLVKRSEALVAQNEAINKKAGTIGTWTTALSVLGLSLIPKRFFNDRSLVKAAAVAFGAFMTGTVTYMGTMLSLTRNIRISEVKSAFSERTAHPAHRASEKLTMEAREAVKRELAVLLENDERSGISYDEYLAAKGVKQIGGSAQESDKNRPDRNTSDKFADKVGQSDRKPSVPAGSHADQVKAQEPAVAAAAR